MLRNQSTSPFATGTVSPSTGLSQPWSVRPEPTSGLNVHVLDFTGLNTRGAGLWIKAGDQRSHPFDMKHRLYDMLAADALRFFYLMRSGTPILDRVVPGYGRPAGISDGRRIAAIWRCPRGGRSAAAVPGVAV